MRFSGFEHMLDYWAAETPDAPSLIFDRGGKQTLSYAHLQREVQERARRLRQEGKSCIGILADGSAECVLTLFAANIAGLQAVMLDAAAPEALLRELIVYTDVDTLWGDDELTEALSPYLTAGVEDGRGKILFFTSGTTDRAKAVVLTDHSLCQSAWNGGAKLPLRREDVLLCVLPLGHVFGMVCSLLWGLSFGAAVALGRGARHFGDDCAHFRPTAISLVPLLLGFMIKSGALNPELKLILVGAGPCPPALLAAAAAKGVRVCFGYGLTETSSGVAISVEGDPYAMEVCPDDIITIAPDGEVLIHAPTCIMQGYYKLPEDTAEALRGGVFHSGDLGSIDSRGRVHLTGRKKDILPLADGTKLFLPEYEAKLSAALGGAELAVIELSGRPTLVIRGELTEREYAEKLAGLMAEYPRGQQIGRIIPVTEPLPRTATGKIQRWEIQKRMEREQ